MAQVKESAEASAELARRMAEVGNFPKLTQAREQAFYAEATAQLARAQHNATAARERLARLMGLWGEELAFQLPERLPDLPKAPREGGDLEAQAIAQRLDVQGARSEAEALAQSLGLTKVDALRQRARGRRAAATARPASRGSAATRSRSACRSSTSAARGSRAPRRSTCRR